MKLTDYNLKNPSSIRLKPLGKKMLISAMQATHSFLL